MTANHEHDDNVHDDFDARVRRRLRALRLERDLTLREVADRASIDLSTLSRLESGKRRLALDHVPALARALGVSTDELLGTQVPRDPRVQGEPRHIADGMTMWPLSVHGPGRGLHAYRIEIDGTRTEPPAHLHEHPGHEWLYVLSGVLRLRLGTAEYLIGPGEAVEFSTLEPHWFGASDGPVELLGLFGPHGEQVHVRERLTT